MKLIIMSFAITYLCEKGFFAYAATETKYRTQINAEKDLNYLKFSQIYCYCANKAFSYF